MSNPPTAPPVLSIVIVNWNAGAALLACLDSIRAQPPSDPYEVIVVDNASSDGSLDEAVRHHPDVVAIRNGENRGLAAANNQGFAVARGEFVLVSNPDVEYQAGAVDAMVQTLRRHPQAAIVVPRLLAPDGSPQTSAGDLPTLRGAMFGRRLSKRAGRTSGFWWDAWEHDREQEIGRGQECAYVVRGTAIEQAGPQDERFVLDWEGIEWTARLRDAGWQVWFTPDALVVHHGGVSIRQAQLRWVLRSHLGMYRYFAKRRPWSRPFVAPMVALRCAAKLAELAVRRDVYAPAHDTPARAEGGA